MAPVKERSTAIGSEAMNRNGIVVIAHESLLLRGIFNLVDWGFLSLDVCHDGEGCGLRLDLVFAKRKLSSARWKMKP